MKKYLEQIKNQKILLLILVILLGFVFYWYEYRPSEIRKDCSVSENGYRVTKTELYQQCLSSRGLKR